MVTGVLYYIAFVVLLLLDYYFRLLKTTTRISTLSILNNIYITFFLTLSSLNAFCAGQFITKNNISIICEVYITVLFGGEHG